MNIDLADYTTHTNDCRVDSTVDTDDCRVRSKKLRMIEQDQTQKYSLATKKQKVTMKRYDVQVNSFVYPRNGVF